ncbi:MAG: 16S rRNA (cytosine(1402)-N(4))-methyltransferase RsmH, partial [Vicinamibacteria bacterium]
MTPTSNRPETDRPRLSRHEPVMAPEVVRVLGVRSGGIYVDATVGDAGHALPILEASSPDGRVIGIDCDDEAIETAEEFLKPFRDRVTLVRSNAADLVATLASLGITKVDGTILDLGLRSRQIDSPGRGFSFRFNAPLDMRMDRRQARTAADLVAQMREPDLATLLRDMADEPRAGRIARAIVRERSARPIATTTDLARIVLRAAGAGARRSRIHPATRVFQAIRMAVNDEKENLSRVLEAWPAIAGSG